MSIITYCLHQGSLSELVDFNQISQAVNQTQYLRWYWTDSGKELFKCSVIFIGQTGYGKSSILNHLLGRNLFETSDVAACTKKLQSALYHIQDNYYVEFADLPGIGESDKADYEYLTWYKEYVRYCHVVVYLLRADKRDHSPDEFFFTSILPQEMQHKTMIGISQADKIEPLSRAYSLSQQQKINLERKREHIGKLFPQVSQNNVVPFSTHINYGIEALRQKIIFLSLNRS